MDSKVQEVFNQYPINATKQLYQIRDLIYGIAQEYDIVISETLKWGEPSYVSPIGSTIRLGWKSQTPDNYYLYFNCKTTLVETIKEVYGEQFVYQGNRALVFTLGQARNEDALAHCLSLSLRYKKLKHLPLLGS